LKKTLVWIILIAFVVTGLAALANSATPADLKLRIAPAAPRFTDAERQAELARRRAALAAKMADNSVMVLFSAQPRLYTNDVNYVYRQENNLYYLTGLKQNNATLVIAKTVGAISETLFIPKRNPLRETWEGKMYSRDDVTRLSGIRTIVDATEQDSMLTALKGRSAFNSKDGAVSVGAFSTIYLLLPQDSPNRPDEIGHREYRAERDFSQSLKDYKIENAQPIFAGLRLIKSPYELKVLQHAIDITTEAQMRSMATVGRMNWEYELQAEVEYTFRRRNADFWGYPSIVGCGPSGTTLHYVESQAPVKKGELVLMDVGAEYRHYTADVTRTFPVNGKFSKEQAEIYQIVYDAQEAVAKATRPGVRFDELQKIARDKISEGLLRVGLITDKHSQQSRIWFMHGLGHWLGMNVHDVGDYMAPLRAGMVFTNEPGIYIREDALDNLPNTPAMQAFKEKVRPVFEKYKNIGVRIEDDMLVTDSGVVWMTKDLPRSIADIQAFMSTGPKQVTLSRRLNESLKQNVFLAAAGR